jgi:hypothetical protein
MRRKFKLINEKDQHLAVIIYFFEEQINSNVGIIISTDLSMKSTWLYQNEQIEDVISDLAKKLKIDYSSFNEVK